MPTQERLIAGALITLATAYGLRMRFKLNHNTRAFINAGHRFEKILDAQEKQNQYLWRLINEHDVPVDEFDMIALNYNHQ